MIDDETLLAYADGELEEERAAAVERMLAGDPRAATKLAKHRRLAERLRAAYDPVLLEPIPEALARRARGGGEVISMAEARAARAARPAPSRAWRAIGLIAAALVAVAVTGPALWITRPGPVVERSGHLFASGDLAHALDTQLSGAGQTIRIDLTFVDRKGRVCRSFTGRPASGVACHEDGRWSLEALFPGQTSANAGEYRMAASGDPRVLRIVGDMSSGDAFDARQEQVAKARRWTR